MKHCINYEVLRGKKKVSWSEGCLPVLNKAILTHAVRQRREMVLVVEDVISALKQIDVARSRRTIGFFLLVFFLFTVNTCCSLKVRGDIFITYQAPYAPHYGTRGFLFTEIT